MTRHALGRKHQTQNAVLVPGNGLRSSGADSVRRGRNDHFAVRLGLLFQKVALYFFITFLIVEFLKPFLTTRIKGNPRGSIEMAQFEPFKRCIQELTFMNEQYITFKHNIKSKRVSNFTEFYQRTKRARQQDAQRPDSDATGSNKTGSDKYEPTLVERCGEVLSSDKPTEVDSLMSEDLQEMSSMFASSRLEKVRGFRLFGIFILHDFFEFENMLNCENQRQMITIGCHSELGGLGDGEC